MKTGFDNEKYLTMQSEHIRETIEQILGEINFISNLAANFLMIFMHPESFLGSNRTVSSGMLMQLSDQE